MVKSTKTYKVGRTNYKQRKRLFANEQIRQGGVISPLLANLGFCSRKKYYGLDKWLENTDIRLKYVRYADYNQTEGFTLRHPKNQQADFMDGL